MLKVRDFIEDEIDNFYDIATKIAKMPDKMLD
jgi:hypothetical protein